MNTHYTQGFFQINAQSYTNNGPGEEKDSRRTRIEQRMKKDTSMQSLITRGVLLLKANQVQYVYTFQSVASFTMSIQTSKPYSVACRATRVTPEMLHLSVITVPCINEGEE